MVKILQPKRGPKPSKISTFDILLFVQIKVESKTWNFRLRKNFKNQEVSKWPKRH